MTHQEQVDAFDNELRTLVNRYVNEFDLPQYALVGIMETVKIEMMMPELDIECHLERLGFEEGDPGPPIDEDDDGDEYANQN